MGISVLVTTVQGLVYTCICGGVKHVAKSQKYKPKRGFPLALESFPLSNILIGSEGKHLPLNPYGVL